MLGCLGGSQTWVMTIIEQQLTCQLWWWGLQGWCWDSWKSEQRHLQRKFHHFWLELSGIYPDCFLTGQSWSGTCTGSPVTSFLQRLSTWWSPQQALLRQGWTGSRGRQFWTWVMVQSRSWNLWRSILVIRLRFSCVVWFASELHGESKHQSDENQKIEKSLKF